MRRIALAMLVVAATVGVGRAEPRPARRAHAVAILIGTAGYVTVEYVARDAIRPAACRWCASNGLDDGIRSALRWDDVDAADRASNVTGLYLAPLAAAGALLATTADAPDVGRWFDDLAPVAEAWLATNLVTQGIKVVAARERPYAHHGAEAVQPGDDAYQSFVSGHASQAFALAASAGMVAQLRGYRSAPAIWAVGMTLAGATAYLRVAADAHYATDVLTGSVVGAGIGLAVPLLFHRATLAGATVVPTGTGLAIAGAF